MKTEKREIESFELSKDYYEESFINGNKSHVAEELSELMKTSLLVFQNILIELPKDIQRFVINSEYYCKATLDMTLQQIRPASISGKRNFMKK